MISASVKVFENFAQVTEDVERLARRGCEEAAQEAQRTAIGIGAARGLTDVQLVPVHGTESGYASGIEGRWYYRFQSIGTLGRAKGAKRPGSIRSHAAGTGITPNMMFQKARTAGRRKLKQVIFG